MQWFVWGTQDLILVQISLLIQSYNFWAQSIVGHDQLSQIADFGPPVGGFNNLKIKNLKAFLSDTRKNTTLSDLPSANVIFIKFYSSSCLLSLTFCVFVGHHFFFPTFPCDFYRQIWTGTCKKNYSWRSLVYFPLKSWGPSEAFAHLTKPEHWGEICHKMQPFNPGALIHM